jgi:hypothetical protein
VSRVLIKRLFTGKRGRKKGKGVRLGKKKGSEKGKKWSGLKYLLLWKK